MHLKMGIVVYDMMQFTKTLMKWSLPNLYDDHVFDL